MREFWKKWRIPILVGFIAWFIFGGGGLGDNFRHLIEEPIFNFLIVIYNIVGDFGVAIIILTLIIRTALWPLVRKQYHQQKKIRELQPEIEKINKATNGNKMKAAQLTQELYKERDIKPAGSMLVMIIQLPIFIALFQIIRIFTTDTGKIGEYIYPALHDWGRVGNIVANPENFHPQLFGLIDLHRTMDIGAFPNCYWPILIFAVLAAVFQYIQVSITMPNQKKKRTIREIFKDTAKGEDIGNTEIIQSSMSSMTKIFPIMTFVIAINFQGALVLYYAITSGIGIIQTKIAFRELENDIEKTVTKKGSKVKNIQEAKIVSNQKSKTSKKTPTVSAQKSGKSGKTKIRRISS